MIQGLFKLCVFIYEMLPQTEEDHWQKIMSNNYPDDFFFFFLKLFIWYQNLYIFFVVIVKLNSTHLVAFKAGHLS